MKSVDRTRLTTALREHVAKIAADLRVKMRAGGPVVQAGESNVSVAYDDAVGKVLKNIGQPLELVNLGQTKASLRLDSRYIKDVLQKADQDSLTWAPVAEHLRDTYGLQPLVIDLFLCFLCQRDHRALNELDNDPIEVRIGMPAAARIRLQRGKLVSAADWHRLRDLGNQLLNVPRPAAHRSLQGQDRFAIALKQAGAARRTVLQGLHQRLVHLGIESGDRLKELAAANTRLAALDLKTTDSHKVLTELLAAWPDDSNDVLRAVVSQTESVREALGELNEPARSNLKAGVHHATVGAEVRDHLGMLEGRLAAAQNEQPLTKDWILSWNRTAQQLIQRLIVQPPPPSPTAPSPGLPPSAPQQTAQPLSNAVLVKARVNPADGEALSRFLAEVRKVLVAQGTQSINVVLVREEDTE